MAETKYLITIIALNEDKLHDDALLLADVPQAVNESLLIVAQHSLDMRSAYLLTAEQLDALTPTLEQNSLDYPALIDASFDGMPPLLAAVLSLCDWRKKHDPS